GPSSQGVRHDETSVACFPPSLNTHGVVAAARHGGVRPYQSCEPRKLWGTASSLLGPSRPDRPPSEIPHADARSDGLFDLDRGGAGVAHAAERRADETGWGERRAPHCGVGADRTCTRSPTESEPR